MTSPSFDTTFTGWNGKGGGSSTATITAFNKTGGTNRVMLLAIGYDSGSTSTHVTGISDGLGALTWSFVGKVQNTSSGSNFFTIEIWAAPASAVYNNSQTNAVQTITFSGSVSAYVANWGAVQGCNSITNPFDSNGGLPASNFDSSSSTTPTTVTFNTSQADDLLVAFTGFNNTFGESTPAGWTNLTSNGENAGDTAVLTTDWKSVSAAQSSATYQNAGTVNNFWTSIVVALTADATSPSGTWASTEAKDTMSMSGFANVGGTFAPTEHTDTMSMAGYPQLKGTWASTERTDTFFTPPALSLDASAHGTAQDNTGSGITSASVTLTTNFDDEVITLCISSGGFAHNSGVTSISDTAGLTWKRRNQRRGHGSGAYQEIWWAHAPTPLSADVITVTTGLTGAIDIVALGVVGANYTAPWDTHTMAGWYNDLQSGNPSCPVNTSATRTFGIAFYGSQGTAEGGSVSSPYTYVVGINASEHNGDTVYDSVAYNIFTAPAVAQSVSFAQSGGLSGDRNVLVDAIVAFGETGTANPVLWYFDGNGTNLVLALTSSNQTMNVNGFTTLNNDLMYVAVIMLSSQTGLGEVTGITDSLNAIGSPGWARRSRQTDSTGTLALEIWWAYSSDPVSNDTINIATTDTESGDTMSVILFAVGGTTGGQTPGEPFWDGSTHLPAGNFTDTGGPGTYPHVTEISTINPNTLNLAFTANAQDSEATGTTLPYYTDNTNGLVLNTSSAGPPANIAIEFMFSPTQVSSQLAEFDTSPPPTAWVIIADAIPVGPAVPPTGTWVSAEHTDQNTHVGSFTGIGIASPGGWVGFPPNSGSWASTEAKDKNTNNGAFTALGWTTGWAGYVPASALWASTEHKDIAAFAAWVIGLPGDPYRGGITGRMAPIELRDRVAASNRSTVTGTWVSTERTDRLASAGFEIPKEAPPAPRKRRMVVVT